MTSPSKSCDRRSFLVRTAAVLGAGLTAACENSPLSPLVQSADRPTGRNGPTGLNGADTLYVFANESGLFTSREPFVVGVLLTDRPGAHSDALVAEREATGFLTELEYSSTDRYKEPYAEAALDHFFESDGLRFAAVATNASRSAGGIDATGLYEALLDVLGGSGASITLRMEPRFLDPAPDRALENRLENPPGGSVEVEFVPAHDSELLQLGDLLTGSVRGDMARKARGRRNPRGRSPKGNVKDRLIASLKDRLDVQQLVHPSLANHDKFNVRVLHPPYGA